MYTPNTLPNTWSTNQPSGQGVPHPDELSPSGPITLRIPRDLAVQLTGSDAGKARRCRPTATMTKDLSAEEFNKVAPALQPFVDAEIHRYHENRSQRLYEFEANATPEQAAILKKMCTRYAAHLSNHLSQNGHDPKLCRSQQRLDQARDVIRQINWALNLPEHDDGRTEPEVRRAVIDNIRNLYTAIATYQSYVTHTPPEIVAKTQPRGVSMEHLATINTYLGFADDNLCGECPADNRDACGFDHNTTPNRTGQ